ncbi:MAG: threonine--tRNA ligase [Verrucomicrobiae bacterium]|nr:threonine--tRNA ligase [Verrucomicrobiae bacterium]
MEKPEFSAAEVKPAGKDLDTLRHSGAHLMACAIARLWPDAQFAAGPAVENGFYYDLDMPYRLSPADFERIEEEMKRLVKENQEFKRLEVSRAEAMTMAQQGRLAALGTRQTPSKFKLDILQGIPEGETISIYQNGEFTDLCAGPHVRRTGELKAFKLMSVASAYYKGDERNPQLQRVYGTVFQNRTQLDEYLAMLEESKKRDHRKLGKELELFMFDEDVGPGLPLWMPNGAVLIEELERLAKEAEFDAGYQRVRTPHVARESLYRTSGHLPYYEDSMFPPMEVKDDDGKVTRIYLKAMNCPHHHKIFGGVPRSYRELPLRMAEYGTCYRYEQSGELFGLMRVRSLQMNDAHIYCSPDQFAAEFRAVNDLYLKQFKVFGLQKYKMRFSTHDPSKLGKKFVNESELWLQTEARVRKVLEESGVDFEEVPNEAAFYGPKIDVQVWSAIGREFTLATNQVDFAVPKRFGLVYTTREGRPETPLCIHRAPLGTHERFIGFLIEHYAGAFPFWLAPEQVRVLPIGQEHVAWAREVRDRLFRERIRVTIDEKSDKIGAKIRNAQLQKIPYMLVIGAREVSSRQVALRTRAGRDEGAVDVEALVSRMLAEIKVRQ